MKSKLLFEEEQSFVGTWMFYLVIGISILALGGTSWSIWKSDVATEGIIALIISGIVCGLIIVFFVFSKLETTIDQDAIYYRYPPFIYKEKKLTKADVTEMNVRKYRPIQEYGGWGYRIRMGKGRALSVAGKVGLQIVMSNNKALLIGTQKPEEMEHAIKRLKEKWRLDG